ncbi:MAG: peptidoglycan N-acetylmuramoylhydrolase [Magnetococcales bacterium]|nr:peptidoglycan N-acetylmuramoylhydrolase [Magnetococcales bacterium]
MAIPSNLIPASLFSTPTELANVTSVHLGRRRLLGWMLALSCFPLTPANAVSDVVARYPWLNRLIDEDGLDRHWLNDLLKPLTLDQRVINLMNSQAEAKPYYLYRPIFINDQRINRCRRRAQTHASLLQSVERRYQVPGKFVMALWSLETDCGDYHDGFNVLRSLFTLATGYPRRAEFFQGQLRHFLLLAREEGWEPSKIQGSFAGAIGQCQMIPETMRRYAVDFDGDGRRDLFTSVPDVLGSIGNFLHGNGWQPNGLYALRLGVDPKLESLQKKWNKQWRTVNDWLQDGVTLPSHAQRHTSDEQASLIRLVYKKEPGFHLVFNNFKVITTWNRSNHFAMVAKELADKVQPG